MANTAQNDETPVFEQTEVVSADSDLAVQIPDHPELSGKRVHPLTLPSPNSAYEDDPAAFGADEAPAKQKTHEEKDVSPGVGDA